MGEHATTAPLAVVFDLDDTLFDSLGQCVVPAHAQAAAAMCAAGLEADAATVLARRWALAGQGGDLDLAVARSFLVRDVEGVARAGRSAFFQRDPGPITPFAFTHPVLAAARNAALTLLLTAGDPRTQGTKIERLGLHAALDEVLVVEAGADDAKRAALAAWLAREGLPPERVLVVGDRPTSEIAAALALCCRALRIRGGECASEPSPFGVPEAADIRTVLRYF